MGSRSIDEPSIGICELRGLGTRAGEVRFGIVRQLVADTDLPSAEIAAALDFSEPAVFTRAFHQWARRAPREWRVRAIHGSRRRDVARIRLRQTVRRRDAVSLSRQIKRRGRFGSVMALACQLLVQIR